MKHKTIAIIGAGPSGLMAAETLGAAGYAVTLYDRMPSAGRKLLMAGFGGLNLTHSEPLETFIARYGGAAEWLSPAIHTFTPEMLRAWCDALGQTTFIGSSGRIFPTAMKAAPLLRAWFKRLEGLNVRFALRHEWLGWEGDLLQFKDAEDKTVLVKADATLLALGGASWPRLGSDGSWFDILKHKWVELSALRPANSGFSVPWSDYFSSRFAGEPLKPVTFIHNHISRQGEAMITEKGLEGGLVYAFSAALREAIAVDGKAELTLDLRPNMSAESLAQKLEHSRGNKSLSTYLRKSGLSPLIVALLREVIPSDQLTAATPAMLAAKLKALPITLTQNSGFARAISTAGGITQSAVDEHFMLKQKPGMFAAGEMLDWEAPTGGYLLQACFSTGVAAAHGIIRFCESKK